MTRPSARHEDELEVFREAVIDLDGKLVPVEEPLDPALASHLQQLGLGATFAVITPCNPDGVVRSPLENVLLLQMFQDWVRHERIDAMPAHGRSRDGSHVERGRALAVSREAAIAIGRQWEQVAVFWFDGSRFEVVPTRGQPAAPDPSAEL